jgi:hypothetical protein
VSSMTSSSESSAAGAVGRRWEDGLEGPAWEDMVAVFERSVRRR